MSHLTIAVASGKGGTGKTTLALNMAVAAGDALYADCDVEAPNGHLFLRPRIDRTEEICTAVPRIDADKCDSCGVCGRCCRFNALAVLSRGVMVFDELCHGCGNCLYQCPRGAIREEQRPIGVVLSGEREGVGFIQGRLNVGEAMSPPLIRALKGRLAGDRLTIIDAPPGTACAAFAAVRGADCVLLVTEPTPFGLNDLALAVEMVRGMGLPHAVVINRCDAGDERVERFCADQRIEVLGRIPEEQELARCYARGELAVKTLPRLAPLFQSILDQARALAARRT